MAIGAACAPGSEPVDAGDRAAPLADPWWFADAGVPVQVDRDTLPTFTLREVARYGTEEGMGELSDVNALSADASVVAVANWRECEIVLFERRSGKPMRRFGRCGGGPNEFRQTPRTTIALRADTLLVTDNAGRRLRRFAMDGTMIDELPLDSVSLPAGSAVASLHFWDADRLLVAKHLPGHRLGPAGIVPVHVNVPAFSLVRYPAMQPLGSALRDPPEVARRVPGLMRSSTGCAVQGPHGPQLVVLNRWAPQLLILKLAGDSAFEVHHNLTVPMSFALREPHADGSGWQTTAGLVDVACADSFALVSQRPLDADERLPRRGELWGWGVARLGLSRLRVSSDGHALLGRLIGGADSSVFILHSSRYDWPQIIEFVVSSAPRVRTDR